MLELLAKFILWRYKPKIIVVMGNIGKTCSQEAIFSVLQKKFRTKRNQGEFEGKRDVIFNILGLENFKKNAFIACLNFLKILVFSKNYPQVFIFEVGIKKPGDSKYLEKLKPEIAVVTAIGEIPVNIEFFAGSKSMALQKFKVLENLPHWGYAVLNYDDETVREMKEEIGAHCLTFGFQAGADLRASDVSQHFLPGNLERSGLNFKLNFNGNIVPIWILGTYGKPQVYAALAASAVGLILKLNLIEVSQALLKEYKSPPGRMTLEKGIKHTWILNDSYEVSPASMMSALQTLDELDSEGRKIAVLGDMMGIGKYTEHSHRAVGEAASKFADLLFCIGPRAKFIADEATKRGFSKEKIFELNSADEAGKVIQNEIKEGDLILIKGSKEIKLEKIVEEIKSF